VLLVVAWALVLVGAGIRMLWLDAPSGLIALVYVVAGWQIVLDMPAYVGALDAAELTMLAIGGGCYSLGAAVYALKRPDPWPAVFGFHEVFHTLVVLGAACHWVAVLLLTR
jgi:hemolysin III